MFGKATNRYKINQSKLTFLPTIFTFFVFLFFLFSSFWYFSPFSAGEIKVLAINKLVKSEDQSGKFFGYLNFYEETVAEKIQSISLPNPEITVKSFDSRLIDDKIFYLSQNCVQINIQNCEFWSFDRTKNELTKLDSSLGEKIQVPNFAKNSTNNSDKFDKTNLKFAEFQEKNWFNFIISAQNSDSYSLLQIDKTNLQNHKTQIITQDNPDYTKYFR